MEMKRFFTVFAIIALCFAQAAFAATSSSSSSSSSSTTTGTAVLQATDSSTVPSTVYPGTSGYAKFKLSNTGTDTASGITVYYNYAGSQSPLSFSSGDISAGSTSEISVPFKVPDDAIGIYTISVQIYYGSLSVSGASSHLASASLPIVLNQYQVLEVKSGIGGKMTVTPGETILLPLVIKNKNGVVNNLVISAPENSTFALSGTNEKAVGSIEVGESVETTVALTTSSSAQIGQYTVPLEFTYQDSLGSSTTETISVGGVNMLEASTQYRLNVDYMTETEVGSEAILQLTIENTGSSPLNAIVDVDATSVFTPIGLTRTYFESIPAGEKQSKNITLGISSSTGAGYYSLPIAITLGSGSQTSQTLGIPVTATPTLAISSETNPVSLSPGSSGKVLVQISNTGNVAVRSVYAKAASGDFTISGATDKFVGTLNVDDFSTFTVSVTAPRNNASGKIAKLPVTITFKDSNNKEYTVKKDVEVKLESGIGSGDFSNGTLAARRSSGVLFGLDWLQLGIILVLLAVVAFFAYGRFFKKKSK